ncbi:hypothetical protein AVEN_219718-1 [Araneus ventricosus]|uniref:Uncharacterized protein n=1 Tax=Araneus ventricosus TaxID=182803 RepID=A0A4Y2NJT5_ARAVE|nr:hypothetical protein AVEN_219718-1 [Araneus ventricosus]
MYLSDGHCNSSSAEAGVLMAITGHGPTPPGGASPPGKRDPAYLSGSFSSVFLWCPWDRLQVSKVCKVKEFWFTLALGFDIRHDDTKFFRTSAPPPDPNPRFATDIHN